ncbi:hypothetical protein ODS41_09850 [Pyrobaculum sp. 3827-6]|nr:hypothetical protein [Pyrobaculum sp. 3827-6]MCU7788212.1 hypothetical protein [Pyrobaculum sp. 3827-6]
MYNRYGERVAEARGVSSAGAVYLEDKLYVFTDQFRLLLFNPNLEKLEEVDLEPELSKYIDMVGFPQVYAVASDGKTIYAVGGFMLSRTGAGSPHQFIFAISP